MIDFVLFFFVLLCYCSSHLQQGRQALHSCSSRLFEKVIKQTMFVCPSLACKPSARKHSYFDKLFNGSQLSQTSVQEKQSAFPASFISLPSSPSKKANPKIYTVIFFLIFFFITMLALLRCNSLDPHVNQPSSTREDDVAAAIDSLTVIPALRGLGRVYRKGTKAMSDLVVANIAEKTTSQDLRLFMRTLHRSGVTARADVVFLFPWSRLPSRMMNVVNEENIHFDKLMEKALKEQVDASGSTDDISSSTSTSSSSSTPASSIKLCVSSNSTISPLNIHSRSGSDSDPRSQPLWGIRSLNTSDAHNTKTILLHEFGSIVGFSTYDLNPDNALQGFINHPPLTLKRWACYQMLLGMLRRKFKHILLTDVSGVAILRDPFRVMGKRRAGLYIPLEDRAWGSSIVSNDLGVRLGSFDKEPRMESQNFVALLDSSTLSGFGRHLQSQNMLNGKGRMPNAVALAERRKSNMASRISASHSHRSHWRQASRQRMDARRRGDVGRRRRGRRPASSLGGPCERVYGRQTWNTLEENEREKKLVNSAVIMGSIQQVRGLANAMVTEIVKVALDRKNRDPFPDGVLLSYLLHKSTSVLGKKVVEHLHLMDNTDSFVHSLIGSQQPSFFTKKARAEPYSVIHGNSKSRLWENAARAIWLDICASVVDAAVYANCDKLPWIPL